MSSKTQIANLSLLRNGVTKFIANVDTEDSKEAKAIRLAFDDERDFVLRDFPWPWARKFATGQLVLGSSTAPASLEWTFAYRYPSDCLYLRRLVLGTAQTRVVWTDAARPVAVADPPPFTLGRDDQGRLIYTNQDLAELEYTSRVTDPEEFDSMFVSMLAWKLASMTAPFFSRMADQAAKAMQMYEIEKTKAQARALNEGQDEKPLEAEWIRGR